MSDGSKYTILAFSEHAVANCRGDLAHITGYDAESQADSLRDARSRAHHLLSDEYRELSESSERLAYAQVIDTAGECSWDLIRPGFTIDENGALQPLPTPRRRGPTP